MDKAEALSNDLSKKGYSANVSGEVVDKYGTSVTFGEVLKTVPVGYFSAAFAVEAASTLINIGVAYYAGACIGALAYATGQYPSGRLFETTKLLNACASKGISLSTNLKNHLYYDFKRKISVKMTRCY